MYQVVLSQKLNTNISRNHYIQNHHNKRRFKRIRGQVLLSIKHTPASKFKIVWKGTDPYGAASHSTGCGLQKDKVACSTSPV